MNISRESFPDIDISMKSNHENELINSTSASPTLSSEQSSSHLKSSENSLEEKRPSRSKRTVFKQKSQSYQDLHSDYTKRRYHHVKSKVKEYIANIQAYDRKGKTILRHRSLPETMGNLDGNEEITNEDDTTKLDSNDDIVHMLHEKDMEVQALRNLNENLESNLQEKIAMLARVKLNADIMRIQVMEMKEKERRVFLPSNHLWPPSVQAHSLWLPGRPSSPTISLTNAVSTATQTDFDLDSSRTIDDPNDCETEVDVENSSCDQYLEECMSRTDSDCNLRRRSNSNSIRITENTAHVIDSSDMVESCDMEEQSTDKVTENETVEIDKFQNSTNKKGKKLKSISWRRVILCCTRPADVEKDFFYTRLPADEIEL